jgi:YD repeat-containing protein
MPHTGFRYLTTDRREDGRVEGMSKRRRSRALSSCRCASMLVIAAILTDLTPAGGLAQSRDRVPRVQSSSARPAPPARVSPRSFRVHPLVVIQLPPLPSPNTIIADIAQSCPVPPGNPNSDPSAPPPSGPQRVRHDVKGLLPPDARRRPEPVRVVLRANPRPAATAATAAPSLRQPRTEPHTVVPLGAHPNDSPSPIPSQTPSSSPSPGCGTPGNILHKPGQTSSGSAAVGTYTTSVTSRNPGTTGSSVRPIVGGRALVHPNVATPQLPATTGINRYWEYTETPIGGVGRYMVNTGTGNVLVQADDLLMAHKGIQLAFRRTYNSQSYHDYEGRDGSQPSNFGQGWTSNLDAHIAWVYDSTGSQTSNISVFDGDGARYDYTYNGTDTWTPPTGQFAVLKRQDANYIQWTKKSGTVYQFHDPTLGLGSDGKAGRIKFIYGRNHNTYLNFVYSFDVSSPITFDHLSQITITAEDGETIIISFQNVSPSNLRLAYDLERPDHTHVTYAYDAHGGLVQVTQPGPGSTTHVQQYAYSYPGNGVHYLLWINDPNWNASGRTVGHYDWFTFDLGSVHYPGIPATTMPALYPLMAVQEWGFINPVVHIPGPYTLANGNIQPDQTATINGNAYSTTTYAYATNTNSFRNVPHTWSTDVRDYDGHEATYFIDGSYRTVERDEYPGATTLAYSQTWNGFNELGSDTDPAGHMTTYAYDTNGNTTLVQKPPVTNIVTDSNGVQSPVDWQPQSRYSYDSSNNLTLYCDATYMYWHQPNSCTNYSVGMTRFTWTAQPGYEPFGELTGMTTPSGISKTISYDPAYQAGNVDYGLPTSVFWVRPFSQADGTPRNPTQLFVYGAHGNLICYNKLALNAQSASGWSVLGYDTANRLTSIADPDDAFITTGLCSKVAGLPGSHIVTSNVYNVDGTLAQSQTPSEFAASVWTTFLYDSNGNETQDTHHYNSVAGTTYKWYDGADRLVEVMMPQDSDHDYYTYQNVKYPWLTRYVYDLSQSAMPIPPPNPYQHTTLNGTTLAAYGNLAKTVEWLPPANDVLGQPQWTDVRGTSFDPEDRVVSSYELAFGSNPKTTNTYDEPPYLGLLTTIANATGQSIKRSYRADQKLNDEQFNGPNQAPRRQTFYDPNGRVAQLGSAFYGTEALFYDPDGNKTKVVEPPNNMDSPATITYAYYPDGKRKTLSVSAPPAYSQASLYSYSYTQDGRLQTLGTPGRGNAYQWSFTSAGRLLSHSDPATNAVVDYFQPSGVGLAYRPYTSPITLGPTTIDYGVNSVGNISSMRMPMGGAYQSFTRDAEGEPTQYQAYMPMLPATSPQQTNVYTTRGELASAQYNSADMLAMWYPYGAMFANGFAVDGPRNWDPRSNMITGKVANDGPVGTFPTTYSFQYDLAGRQFYSVADKDDGNGVHDHATSTRTYDAEDHILQTVAPQGSGRYFFQTFPYSVDVACTADAATYRMLPDSLTYGWGADGRLLTWSSTSQGYTNTKTLHWDGDDILFTSSNLTKESVFVGKLGLLGGSVTDRDWTGVKVSSHWQANAPGHNGFTAWQPASPGRVSQFQGCAQLVHPNVSNHWRAPSSDQSTLVDPGPGSFEPTGLDGWTDRINTFQGVRTYDPNAGQWTTPDAYAGDVQDPLTQKPFMWNRNNSFAYADPSGYLVSFAPGAADVLVPLILLLMKSPSFLAAFIAVARDPRTFTFGTSPGIGGEFTYASTSPDKCTSNACRRVTEGRLTVGTDNTKNDQEVTLAHEVGHAYDSLNDADFLDKEDEMISGAVGKLAWNANREEARAYSFAYQVAKELNLDWWGPTWANTSDKGSTSSSWDQFQAMIGGNKKY